MLFSNPSIIESLTDVKLGMIEVGSSEINYLSLMSGVRDRLVELITADVDQIVSKGDVSREDAVQQISARVFDMLSFFEKGIPTTEDELADEILKSKEFDLWQMRTWGKFKDIHKGKIEKDTPIPSQGVVALPENDVTEALADLTLEGVLEVLMSYN